MISPNHRAQGTDAPGKMAARPRLARATTRVPVLRVENLQIYFELEDGRVLRAVNGVSLSLALGETLAIVGESGSGKSVTGMSIMRILGRTPARHAGGSALFTLKSGEQVDLMTAPERRVRRIRGREIAMIFQDPSSSLNPVFPVGDQIAEGLRIHQGLSREASVARATQLLALVGIADPHRRIGEYPHQLSGGMRQRVMIAMALACDPRLMIADEPTTALDVTIPAQIVELLRELQRERGMAMIFISHDLHLVAGVADRIAVMYCGQVVEEGPVEEVLDKPRHPYTMALLECIPERDQATGAPVVRPIPGQIADPLNPPAGCKFHPRCRYAVKACRQTDVELEAAAQGHMTRCIRWKELQ